MKTLLTIAAIFVSLNVAAQKDTSKCYLLVLKDNGKSNFIYAYQVTEFNSRTQSWDHVKYLKENGKAMRKKRTIFVESMR